MEEKLKIHEIARIYHCSVRTLQYYDDIGLMVPKRTEGGQRYYSWDDMNALDTIFALKKVGLSLKEIRASLQDADTAQRMSLLEGQIGKLDEQITELSRTKEQLLSMKSFYEEYRSIPEGEIRAKSVPAREIFTRRLDAHEEDGGVVVVAGGSRILADFSLDGRIVSLSQEGEETGGTHRVRCTYRTRSDPFRDLVTGFVRQGQEAGFALTPPVRVRDFSWLDSRIVCLECALSGEPEGTGR